MAAYKDDKGVRKKQDVSGVTTVTYPDGSVFEVTLNEPKKVHAEPYQSEQKNGTKTKDRKRYPKGP